MCSRNKGKTICLLDCEPGKGSRENEEEVSQILVFGSSDLAMLRGRVAIHRIKGTVGITG